MEHVSPLLFVLLAPAAAALALFLVPGKNVRMVRFVAWLGTAIALAAAIFAFVGFDDQKVDEWSDNPGWTAEQRAELQQGFKYVVQVDWVEPYVEEVDLSFKLGVDGMGMALTLLTAITIFTGVMVSFSIKTRVKEYYICLLALVTGVFGVFTSLDLFFYYFFYELAVIPMFLLIGIWGSTTVTVDRNYATMKLVLQLSTGAVIGLIGLIWMYAQAGTFDMVQMAAFEFDPSDQMIWFPFVFLGFATLVPMWPLHSWSPAGHAAAPAAVSMLHAGVLMKLGAFSIIRFCFTCFPDATQFYLPIVGVLCCMNIIYGGLVAMHQKDLKLMIGYSSSSHMGYVLLGMASLTILGLDGAVFLMFAHGLMTALLFSLVGFFYDQTHTRMKTDLGGLMRVMPFIGTCFVFGAMASVGLPGFANFISEMMVIFGSWQNGWEFPSWYSILPPVLAVWGLVISGVYLLRAVKDVWYGDMPERWKNLKDARGLVQKAPFVLLIATLIFFGFYPQPMLDVIHQGTVPVIQNIWKDSEEGGRKAKPPAAVEHADRDDHGPGHGDSDDQHDGEHDGEHGEGR